MPVIFPAPPFSAKIGEAIIMSNIATRKENNKIVLLHFKIFHKAKGKNVAPMIVTRELILLN